MNAVRVTSAAVVLLLSLAVSAAAQTAVLKARVTDPDRAAFVGAALVLTHVPSGTQQTGITRDDGTLQMEGLPLGEYRAEISAAGFTLHTQTVTLGAENRALDIGLEIAGFREEVTVEGVATVPTIGRIRTPLRDQPLTVNTLTSEFLQAHAINDVVTALQNVSSVAAYTTYGVYQSYSFRGFSDSVMMVDGIRNEGNRVNTQLANVDRLEVLKGPSSVLYGSSAIGAAVNLVLKKPSAEPVYDASMGAGRWETYRGSFGAGGRLVGERNGLFYRLDVGGESATNFRHDPSKRLNVTPSLMWRLSNAAQLDVRHMFDRVRVSGDGGIPLVPLTVGFVPDPERTAIGDPLSRAVQGDGTDVIPKVSRDARYNTQQDFGLGVEHNTRVSYSHMIGTLAFRDTMGYRYFDDEYWTTEFLDVTPPSRVNRGLLYFKHHGRPWVNQAELAGRVKFGVDHDVLVGWDYHLYDNATDRRAAANFNVTPMDLFNPVETYVPVDVSTFPVTRIDYSTQRTHGVFVQDAVALTSQLKVVAGVRVDRLRRSAHNNPIVNGTETEGVVTRGRSGDVTYRAGVVYQPTGTFDLYAQNSTSFKPNFSVQPDGTLLDPEYGELREVGQRLRMIQDRLELSSAVYEIEKRNVARSLGGGRFEQIGKVRSRGFEADLRGRLTSMWNVDLGYGFTKAKLIDFLTNAGANLSGNVPRRAPEHTLSVSTTYGWQNGVSLTAGARVVGEQFINDNNAVAFSSYKLLNLGASYTTGRVQFVVNLTNVTDEVYWTSSLGNRQLYPGQPFNAMGTVRVRTN
jgi:iron complex outermembrane recepter protein